MRNDGGTAFPFEYQSGMTLRDYLASKAMQGLLTLVANGDDLTDKDLPSDCPLAQVAASQAYYIADAMLAEREK